MRLVNRESSIVNRALNKPGDTGGKNKRRLESHRINGTGSRNNACFSDLRFTIYDSRQSAQ